MNRIERIREMEQRMDRVAQWLETMTVALEQHPSVRDDVYELSTYYESDLWRADYEADEAGTLPADRKRGILSEDGLYNLLTEYEGLIEGLRESGGGKQLLPRNCGRRKNDKT